MKIGLLIVDIDEYLPFLDVIKDYNPQNAPYFDKQGCKIFVDGNEIYTVCCGIGKVNAAAATAYLLDNGYEYIMNIGYSGGISGVKIGDCVVCTKFIEHDFDMTAVGYKTCEKPNQEYVYYADKDVIEIAKRVVPGIKEGPSVTGDSFISDDKKRDFFKTEFGAVSCDMETGAIAAVCYFRKAKFMSLRMISDNAGDDSGIDYKETLNAAKIDVADYIVPLVKAITSE